MIKLINNVFSLIHSARNTLELPIVFDSPHSGTVYPTNSGIVAPAMALKTTWDAYVDELWAAAPDAGAALLAARFPRAYIDTNRSSDDIDPELLATPWDGQLAPSDACKRGMGLIRRYALPNVPMYAERLPVNEVRERISRYYEPYHTLLSDLLNSAHSAHGTVWHINCHSMKSVGNAMNVDSGSGRPDMVVSDYNGTTCDTGFTEWTAGQLRKFGYSVSINDPYQGGYIVRRYGRPDEGRNSIQIEINRRLYMNEASFEKNEGFEKLKENLDSFVFELAGYVKRGGQASGPSQGKKIPDVDTSGKSDTARF